MATVREDLENAWDEQVIKEARARMAKRAERAKGLPYKAGAMGVTISTSTTDQDFKDGDAAYDHVMNMDEVEIENAQKRIELRRKGKK